MACHALPSLPAVPLQDCQVVTVNPAGGEDADLSEQQGLREPAVVLGPGHRSLALAANEGPGEQAATRREGWPVLSALPPSGHRFTRR